MSTPDESSLFGLAAVVTALATLVQTIRSAPPRPRRAKRRRRAPEPDPPPPAPPSSDPPPAPAAARGAVAWRLGLTLVFAAASLVTGGGRPAFALDVAPHHHADVSGSASCAAGDQLVRWSIGNSDARRPMTITSAVAALDGAPWPVVGYVSPVAAHDATEATTTLPSGPTGSLTLTVAGSWPDGHQSTRSASVALVGDCSPATSTSTSSTSSPAPSTSTSSPAPSTSVAGVSTVPATGGSSISQTPPAQLADTGGPVLDAAIAGAAVVLLGLVFVMAYRVDRQLGQLPRITRRVRRRRRARTARRRSATAPEQTDTGPR